MTLSSALLADPGAPLACVAALEDALGLDTILAVGMPRASVHEVLREDHLRVVVMTFTSNGVAAGSVAIVATAAFGEALEASAADEMFSSACRPGLEAAAVTIGSVASQRLDVERAIERDLDWLAGAAELVVFPILDGTQPVGCFVAFVGAADELPEAAPRPTPTRGRSSQPGRIMLAGESPLVLADVEMGVTAEIGRCRMTVRDVLALGSGAVIDLDRLANQPVDVLVNGTPIARGEIVVVDDEFAIRISEIFEPAP
jgi:flagellar motor switch protein FliN